MSCTCKRINEPGNPNHGKRIANVSCPFHGTVADDPIGILLETLKGKLAACQLHQREEHADLAEFMQRIENALFKAKLAGNPNAMVTVPPLRMLQAFRGANEERRLMTECMVIICQLLGSIIVQVEPGTLETADGQEVLPFKERPHVSAGYVKPIVTGHEKKAGSIPCDGCRGTGLRGGMSTCPDCKGTGIR